MPHSSSGSMARPSIADLEQAALAVIRLMQGVDGFANIRLAVVGDLAVKKYVEQSGPCESIEFLIARSASASLVKKTLLAQGKGAIVSKAQAIFYKHPSGWAIEIKITPEWLCPFFPCSAQVLADIETLPYISLTDLVVFKADACGVHESTAGRQKEAYEASILLQVISEHSPLRLDDLKMDKVGAALDMLVAYSPPEIDRRWWERRLGIQSIKRQSGQDILSELTEGLRFDEEESRRARRRPSVFSLHTRGSDTSISSTTTPSLSSQNSTPVSSPPPKMRPRKMSVSGTYPRPRRHTQTNLDAQLGGLVMSSPVVGRDHHEGNLQYAELRDSSGRNSPGLSFMTFPGKNR
ncbi:hypothetical protein F4777DRAFT_3299 [Nemania sp. FL0916]|nr:hypothetical protein F4777DRAFT_3299 [Nemania sp. FL0916]